MSIRKLRCVRIAIALLVFAITGLNRSASAECPADWHKTDGFPGAGWEADVHGVATWDPDGAGPQAPRLVAGGTFHYMSDRVADSIALLNPDTGQWEDLAGGVDDIVEGEEGSFDQAVVTSLAVFQDDLIVGGIISDAGGVPVNNIARWDGTSWSPLGTGLNGFSADLTVYNGELIAAGDFTTTGSGTTVNRIARWNGTEWLPLGSPAGVNGPSERAVSVIFGGGTTFTAGDGQTWEWDGEPATGTWTQQVVSGPSPRTFVKMAYDSLRCRMVLFGGYGSGQFRNDTWEFGSFDGDLNDDGEVDLADHAIFVNCVSGPGSAFPTGCDDADVSTDGDVDLGDVAEFQTRFGAS